MNDLNTPTTNAARLGTRLRQLRTERELSVRGLAGAARVDATWLSRVERGAFGSPDARSLARLATALGVEASELFLAAGYESGETLPGLAPYLRAKYELPDAAVAELLSYFDFINQRYGEKKGGSDGRNDQ